MNKETITVKREFREDDIFEIVDEVPLGYKIWNIGKHMPDGYLPFVQVYADRSVEPSTMKAIKTEGAQTILAAIGGGEDTIEKMEQYIKLHQNAEPGTYAHIQVQRIKAALPYMRQLKWPLSRRVR